jgi:hypothetical protein
MGVQSKMGLETTFSDAKILAYSKACIDLAESVYKLREADKDFNTLIIPSRGAVPFFLGLVHTLSKKAEKCKEHRRFYHDIGVHDILAPLIEVAHDIGRKPQGKKLRVLMAPFTADLNVQSIYPGESNDEYTKKTREYWANVIASFYKPQSERRCDPYLNSFLEILTSIEDRPDIANVYADFPTIKRAGMIDTVISGRASNDILTSFDSLAEENANENLKPHAFLIVDQNGDKLYPRYNRYLQQKRDAGQAELYCIPSILSEDEGAALEGVVATIYPSIMKASKSLSLGADPFKKEFFLGAGSWHILPENEYMVPFRDFMELIYAGIDFELAIDDEVIERFEDKRDKFLRKYSSGRDITSHNDVVTLDSLNLNADEMEIGPLPVYSTRSYVTHIPFTDASTRTFINKICHSTGARKIAGEIERENIRAVYPGLLQD